ncbi:hypothetical protein E2562_000969 [Oryza meyeriana var. granulata]|uniref:Uncharacterized protein n=1 Tax=Oryza meyeriana var. granulata TaxID=110450 RepID=A0A6G1D0B4_9ORYZ|nr:hypothetical protein E2562_000969 [Oryza meyeriana var. granulata]
MEWLRPTMAAVICSGENTEGGMAADPSGSDGDTTTTPEVAGDAVVEDGASRIAGDETVVEAAEESMIGKVSDTKLVLDSTNGAVPSRRGGGVGQQYGREYFLLAAVVGQVLCCYALSL